MKRLLAALTLAAIMLSPGSHVLADGDSGFNINEDASWGGCARVVENGDEGSVADLHDLNYNCGFPSPGCHGDDWPTAHPHWNNCISSFIVNVLGNDCMQMWAGQGYTGHLIYSRTTRPGDSFGTYYVSSMGSDNDTASSIRLGHWQGTRNAGSCSWLS